MFLLINAVDTTAKTFKVLGDVTATITAGSYIQVFKSTGNNGIYKLSAVAYANGITTLTSNSNIPSAVADGNIAGGVYELKFANPALSGKSSLIVGPWASNTATSLTFNGKASLNYGNAQQQNILSILENFASATAPTNPTIGQHWYDSTNDVVKTYTATGWSSNVNVDGGSISFKDPQHPTPNTKYFLTATEPTGLTASGVTLYPAINPSGGQALFRIVDAAGVVYFEVDYQGKLVSANPLNITGTTDSTFVSSATFNTGAGSANGITVNKNVSVLAGNVVVDSGQGLTTASGAAITMTTGILLKGASSSNNVVIQTTSGGPLATFANAAITFTPAVTMVTANVTGTATIATANATTLGVSGTATIATANVTGTATIATANATTLGVSGTATIATANVTGIATLATANVTNLTVTNSTSITGTVSLNGNLDLKNGFRVINALDPVNPQDYVTLNSLNNMTINGGTF